MRVVHLEGEAVSLETVPFGAVVQHPSDRHAYYMVVNLRSVRGHDIYQSKGDIDLIALKDGMSVTFPAKTMMRIAHGEFQVNQLGNKEPK